MAVGRLLLAAPPADQGALNLVVGLGWVVWGLATSELVALALELVLIGLEQVSLQLVA